MISAFKMIEGDHSTLQRGVYMISNVLAVALAVYKCQVMGLLPTHPSDWLAFVEPQTVSNNQVQIYLCRGSPPSKINVSLEHELFIVSYLFYTEIYLKINQDNKSVIYFGGKETILFLRDTFLRLSCESEV